MNCFRMALALVLLINFATAAEPAAIGAATMTPPPWASKDKHELENKSEGNLAFLKTKKIIPGSYVWVKVYGSGLTKKDDKYVQLHGLTKLKILSITQEVEQVIDNIDYYELGSITFKVQDADEITYTLCEHDIDGVLDELSTQNLEIKAKKWGKRIFNAIKDRKVVIGMTKEQVLLSWGYAHVNRTVGKWGTHEQWVYGENGPYVYFENDKLTSFQD
jgi:hypothetical protein